jgi:hypothetical protein
LCALCARKLCLSLVFPARGSTGDRHHFGTAEMAPVPVVCPSSTLCHGSPQCGPTITRRAMTARIAPATRPERRAGG